MINSYDNDIEYPLSSLKPRIHSSYRGRAHTNLWDVKKIILRLQIYIYKSLSFS